MISAKTIKLYKYWREGTHSVTGDVTGEIVSPAPPGKGGDVIRLELDTRSDAVILNVSG